jgi:hypothetical protein
LENLSKINSIPPWLTHWVTPMQGALLSLIGSFESFPAPCILFIMPKYDTKWTDYPTCPHCGFIDEVWWDGLPPKNDGDSWNVDCGGCEKKYVVTMSVSCNFDTIKGE